MEQVIDVLIERGGLLGALVIVLILVVRWQNTRMTTLQDKYEDQINILQDKRFEEHKSYIERMFTALGTNTEVTKTAAEGFKALTSSNSEIKQELTKISGIISDDVRERRAR